MKATSCDSPGLASLTHTVTSQHITSLSEQQLEPLICWSVNARLNKFYLLLCVLMGILVVIACVIDCNFNIKIYLSF